MLPLIRHYRREATLDWRSACLWGLASGVGFGVSEGITYASNYYNGVETAEIYTIRFISCVALHAIWSGAAAISLFERQDLIRGKIEGSAGVLEFLLYLLTIVAVPMVLHGFYDTLLKKQMNGLTLCVAVASFGWIAFRVERMSRLESQPHGGSDGNVVGEPMVSLRGFFTRRIVRKFKRVLGGLLLIVAAVTTWEFRTPFTSYAHYLSALAAQRNVDEAIAEFREVVRISPQGASAHSNLGVALERQQGR